MPENCKMLHLFFGSRCEFEPFWTVTANVVHDYALLDRGFLDLGIDFIFLVAFILEKIPDRDSNFFIFLFCLLKSRSSLRLKLQLPCNR